MSVEEPEKLRNRVGSLTIRKENSSETKNRSFSLDETNAPTNPITRPMPPSFFLPIIDKSNQELKEMNDEILTQTHITKLHLFRNLISIIPGDIKKLNLLQDLDLSYNRINILPDELCELVKLERIHLIGNTVCVLPQDMNRFTSLTYLNLTANKIKNFPTELTKIPNLSVLEISRNLIPDVPLEIRYMTSLTRLNLSTNKIREIPSHIGSLTNLNYLGLSQNKITSIPFEIGNLQVLSELDLSENRLTSVPSSAANLLALIKLNLNRNQIGHLQEELFEQEFSEDNEPIRGLVSLQELYLAQNRLSELPEVFYNLTTLQILNLTKNNLTRISTKIEQLQNLYQLYLGSNQIAEIPNVIGHLQYLETLNLFNNKLKSLPPEITHFAGLVHLYLGYNQLETIPLSDSPEYLEWESLEELYLSGNHIKKLPEAIGNLWTLRSLYVGNSGLTDIPKGISYLTNLTTLDFGENELNDFPLELKSLTELQRLKLCGNKIEKIPEDVLDDLNFLQEIDLTKNNIKEIPSELNDLLEREADVYLDNNPCNKLENQKKEPAKHDSKFLVGWSEMIGRRSTMEDAFILDGKFEDKEDSSLYAVFDGHATNAAACFCARTFPEVIHKKLKENDDIVLALKESFPTVNELFREYIKTQDIHVKHSGSTALVTLIRNNTIYLANVGDTRAVLCRKGKAIRISKDHKPMDEEDRITALGGCIIGESTRRINGLLAVSRTIGDYFMEPFITDEPYVAEVPITEDDEFLIIACDGVWDEITDQESVDICRNEKDPFIAAAKLRDFGYLLGSEDNVSVIVIKFQKP